METTIEKNNMEIIKNNIQEELKVFLLNTVKLDIIQTGIERHGEFQISLSRACGFGKSSLSTIIEVCDKYKLTFIVNNDFNLILYKEI